MPSTRLLQSRPATSGKQIRARVWTAGRILLLAVAVVVTFTAFFLTSMRVVTHAREVKVPDVRGKTVADAQAAMDRMGLTFKVDARRADDQMPADHVLSQDPSPGEVIRRERAVRVRVSNGKQSPAVPDVVGQAERTAEVVLSDAKIQIGSRVEIVSAHYAADTVVGQDPQAKEQAATVALLVNRGDARASFVMPDVIGTVAARAVDVLRQRGFRVTVTGDNPYPGLPPGIVIRQTPQAGYEVDAGAPVQLEMSR